MASDKLNKGIGNLLSLTMEFKIFKMFISWKNNVFPLDNVLTIRIKVSKVFILLREVQKEANNTTISFFFQPT